MLFEINFIHTFGIFAFSFGLQLIDLHWCPEYSIDPLTCILFHNYENNIWLYILFENRVVAAESASGCGNWSQLRKQMSAAETDTAIIWVNENERMTND